MLLNRGNIINFSFNICSCIATKSKKSCVQNEIRRKEDKCECINGSLAYALLIRHSFFLAINLKSKSSFVSIYVVISHTHPVSHFLSHTRILSLSCPHTHSLTFSPTHALSHFLSLTISQASMKHRLSHYRDSTHEGLFQQQQRRTWAWTWALVWAKFTVFSQKVKTEAVVISLIFFL